MSGALYASSVFAPRAIASQNRTRSCRHATVGRPGDGICPRNSCTSRCRSLIVPISNTSIIEVLQRPVESGQFRARKVHRALGRHEMVGSMGQVGSAGDNGLYAMNAGVG